MNRFYERIYRTETNNPVFEAVKILKDEYGLDAIISDCSLFSPDSVEIMIKVNRRKLVIAEVTFNQGIATISYNNGDISDCSATPEKIAKKIYNDI